MKYIVKKFSVLFLFVVVLLLIFYPLLIGGNIFTHKWVLPDQYPRIAFISRSLANNESVLWTDDFLSGSPIFLSVWGDHVQPVMLLLLKIFNYLDVIHWVVFFNLLTGALLLYLLARNLALSKLASILAASVFVLNQWMVSYLGLLLFWSYAAPVIPLLFLSILKIHRGEKKYFLWGVIALAFGWLSVMMDIMFYITLSAFVFALFLDLSKTDSRRRFNTVFYFVMMVAVGFLFALPKILPTLNFIELSARSTGVVQQTGFLASAQSHGYIGPFSVITIFLPYFSVLFMGFIPFLSGASKLTLLYIGAVPLFLLAIFFINFRKIIGDNRMFKYFAGLFIFVLLILIKYVPLFYLLHKIPPFKFSGGTGKWASLGFFALSILLGATLDQIPKIKQKLNFKRFILGAKYLVIFAVSSVVILNVVLVVFRNNFINRAKQYFETNLYYQATTQRPIEHYYNLIERTFDSIKWNISFTNFHFVVSLLFLILSFLVFYYYYRGKIGDLKFKKIAVFVTLLNFVVIWQGLHNTIPKETITEPPASIEFLQNKLKEEKPFRVFRIWAGLRFYADNGLDIKDLEAKTRIETAMLALNYSLLYDIPFVGGHENIMSIRA